MNPKKFFFIILGVIVAVVGVSGYGYYYAMGRLDASKTTWAASLKEESDNQTQLDALAKMKSDYAKEVVPELPLMDAALPRTKDQTALLSQLRTLANTVGLSLGTVTFSSSSGLPTSTSQTTAAAGYLALPVSFDVQGSFAQLQTFLINLEKLNRFTNVASLTVSRPDKTKPIVYSIALNAYVKP